jgi:hypothetical protein
MGGYAFLNNVLIVHVLHSLAVLSNAEHNIYAAKGFDRIL